MLSSSNKNSKSRHLLASDDNRFEQIQSLCLPYASLLILSAWIGVGLSYSKLYFFHIALLVFFWRFSAAYIARSCPSISVPRSAIVPIFFLAWMFCSLFWAADVIATIKYLFYYSFGLSLLLIVGIVFGSSKYLKRAVSIILAVVCVELVLAILEFTTPIRYPISPYSGYAHLFGHSNYIAVSWTEAMIQFALSAPTGFHWNPNNLAAAFVLILPFSLFSESVWIRRLVPVAILLVIFFTGSRASYAACVVAICVWGFCFKAKRAALMTWIAILTLSVAASMTFAFLDSQNELARSVSAVVEVASNLDDLDDDKSSLGTRSKLMSSGLEQLVASGGLGVGGGNSKVLIQEQISGEWKSFPLHNFWLELLVEGGVFAGSIFVLWYFWLIWRLYSVAFRASDVAVRNISASIATALIAFVPASVSPSSVIYFLPMWLVLGLAVATLNIASRSVAN